MWLLQRLTLEMPTLNGVVCSVGVVIVRGGEIVDSFIHLYSPNRIIIGDKCRCGLRVQILTAHPYQEARKDELYDHTTTRLITHLSTNLVRRQSFIPTKWIPLIMSLWCSKVRHHFPTSRPHQLQTVYLLVAKETDLDQSRRRRWGLCVDSTRNIVVVGDKGDVSDDDWQVVILVVMMP